MGMMMRTLALLGTSIILAAAQDLPIPQPQPQQKDDPAATTRAAARIGKLERDGQIQLLKNVVQVPADRIPEITETNKADLLKACAALPDAGNVTLGDMLKIYQIAGPKGIHYLYDTKRLSEDHAKKFKDLRDNLNDKILTELGKTFGKVGVNNFGSGGNCRSDHDQTIFTEGDATPKQVIDAYIALFKAETKTNYDPSIIELSNFDGSETFPDWRLVKSVGVFGASLKVKFASIPNNPEAYPLIGAFREIVDISSFDAPKTYTEYTKDGKEVVDAREKIYKGLRPEQRRAHGAGAAIANWYFHNHHGGGKDPIEQAKYFLRNVGYGGYLVSHPDTTKPEFKIKGYDKLSEAEKADYIKGIFGDVPEDFRFALDVAVKIRQLKHSAKDPDTGLLKPEILKDWAEKIQKAEGKTPAEALTAAQERYNATKMEMMTKVMIKSFPHLVQNWMDPPKDMEHVRKKIRLHCQVNKILPGKLDDQTLRTTLQMTNYYELRNLMKMVTPELAQKMIDACPPEHRKHVEALKRSVDAERAMRNAPPGAPLTHFQKAKELAHELKVEALWAKWQVEKFYSDPKNSTKEIAKRMWQDMVDEVGEKLGAKAKVEVDKLGQIKVTKEYSAKDFFQNNMNMANGLAAVHAMEAYINAEPGKETQAFAECIAFELMQQLPYIGGMFDLKAALNGDMSGVAMNLGGRLFPQIMKRYLAITLLVDAAVVSAKVFGWATFDMIAKDKADMMYLGKLPAKEAGVVIPGNKEQEALLPGLVQLLEPTADAKKIAGFTQEEEEALKEFSDVEKQRRMVWIHFQPMFEEYLRKMDIVRGNYEKQEQYDKARAAMLTALLYGGEAEGKTVESVIKITVRKFLKGQLFKDQTDIDVYAGVFAKLPHDMEERLTARLFKDYEYGITAHAHYMSEKSIKEAKESREAVQDGMGPIYALNDALKADPELQINNLAGQLWEDHLVPPMEPVIRLEGYRVKEDDREDVQVRVCVYGSALDHPLPWDVKIVVVDSKKNKTEGKKEIKTDVAKGVVNCDAAVADADGKPVASGNFTCGIFGGVVKVELKSVEKDRQKQILVSLINPPENKGTTWHEVSFYRAANPDGPYFLLAGNQDVKSIFYDTYPFYIPGQRTWYYACSIRRKERGVGKDGPLSAPTPISLDHQCGAPNNIEVNPKGGPQAYVEFKSTPPAEPQQLEMDLYKSYSSGGPFLFVTSSGYPYDGKPLQMSDNGYAPGATIYYKFLNKRRPGYMGGVMFSEAVSKDAKLPGESQDIYAGQPWTMRAKDFRPYGIEMREGQSIEFKAEGKGQFIIDEIKEEKNSLAKTSPHGPEGMARGDIEKLRDAQIGINDRWLAKELARNRGTDHNKWAQESHKSQNEYARKRYGEILEALFAKDQNPGAALAVFMARERKEGEMTIVPLSAGTFKAPALGHLMWVVNTSEKVWNNFKDEYKYKVQYSLGMPKPIAIPAPAVEIVQVGGRHGVWEAKFDLKEYKPPAGLKPTEFYPSIFASEGPNDPMIKFDQSYRTPFLVQSRMGLANNLLPPGMELYLRVASRYEIVSPAVQVKAPKSFTCKVYELMWPAKDAPTKSDGFSTTGYAKMNDPDAVIAVREGQTITLSVEGGEWNLFSVEGGPKCTSEGLTADQMKAWVESIKGKVKNTDALRALESGEFGRIPGVRMGALVAQFWAQKDAGVDLVVLGKGPVTLKAPCDGTLRLRPNYLNYFVESDLKRAGVAERLDRGPGLSVRVTVE